MALQHQGATSRFLLPPRGDKEEIHRRLPPAPEQGEWLTPLLPCLAESLATESASFRPGVGHPAVARVPPSVGPALPALASPVKMQIPGPTQTYGMDSLGVGPRNQCF